MLLTGRNSRTLCGFYSYKSAQNASASARSTSRIAEKAAVLPKRGDKDFEPASGGETRLQSYSLDRSRQVMVQALKGARTISRQG
jgi:hypothetical protein